LVSGLASNNFTIPKLFGGFEWPGLMDEEIEGSPRFWEAANFAAVFFRELPAEYVEVLSHPLIVEAFYDDAISLLKHPPNAHLHSVGESSL